MDNTILRELTQEFRFTAEMLLDFRGREIDFRGTPVDILYCADEGIGDVYCLVRFSPSLDVNIHDGSIQLSVSSTFPDGQRSITAFLFKSKLSGFIRRNLQSTSEQLLAPIPTGFQQEHEIEMLLELLEKMRELPLYEE